MAQAKRPTQKIAAIAAGALVVGVGAIFTLASWNDSEWVWGGASGNPGIGTSSFNVVQSVDFTEGTGTFTDAEENPGGELLFEPGALSMSPGDTIYAPVALRSDAGSVAGSLHLQGAVPATEVTVEDADGHLWDNITVNVFTANAADTPGSCDDDFDAGLWGTLLTNTTLDTAANADDTQIVDANGASTQLYCFQLTLNTEPAADTVGDINDLQGRSIAPAWEFVAVSE